MFDAIGSVLVIFAAACAFAVIAVGVWLSIFIWALLSVVGAVATIGI